MERAPHLLVGVATAAVALQYALVVVGTLGHPYQLEWMEGGALDVVARVLAGQPMYQAPDVDYVPYIYPPLYFVVVAAPAAIVGVDLWVARGVSLLAVLGVCALLYRAARRETGERWHGLASTAIFLAGYELTGRWLHLARVDSLYLLLLVAGVVVLRRDDGVRASAVAGLVWSLAFLTKQTTALFVAPILISVALVAPRRAVALLAGFALPSLLATVLLSATTGGWFVYFAFELPATHDVALLDAAAYLGRHAPALAPAALVATAAVLARVRRDRERHAPLLGVLAGGALATLVGFAHTGSHLNALLPGLLAVALLAPLGLAELSGPRSRVAGALALVAQLALLTHPTGDSLPTAAQRADGDALMAWLAARPPEVLMPDHRFLQTRVGHRSRGLGMAARDVLRAPPDDPGRRALAASLAEALAARRFQTIVLSQQDWLGGAVALHYQPAGTVRSPAPITGWPSRPRWVWVPATSPR